MAPLTPRVRYAAVVYVLWLRQLTRYARSRARIVSSIAQPLLFLVAFGFGFGPMYAKAQGGSYIDFLAPGIIMMTILFTAMFHGIEVVWDKQFGFLKETLVAPVPRLVTMIGRTLGGATVALLQGVLVFLVTLAVGFRPQSAALVPAAFGCMFVVAVLFTAIGTGIASRLNDMHAFPLVMNFINMPLFFLSGALFPVDHVPAALKVFVLLNPVAYGVDAVRGTLVGMGHFGLATDLAVLLPAAAAALLVGALLFERLEA